MRPYECDGLSAYRQLPLLVVLPRTVPEVQRVLSELLERRERALVLLEPALARCDAPALQQVWNEGGRVVVTEIPPLHAPDAYHPTVEELLVSVLGPRALEEPR